MHMHLKNECTRTIPASCQGKVNIYDTKDQDLLLTTHFVIELSGFQLEPIQLILAKTQNVTFDFPEYVIRTQPHHQLNPNVPQEKDNITNSIKVVIKDGSKFNIKNHLRGENMFCFSLFLYFVCFTHPCGFFHTSYEKRGSGMLLFSL